MSTVDFAATAAVHPPAWPAMVTPRLRLGLLAAALCTHRSQPDSIRLHTEHSLAPHCLSWDIETPANFQSCSASVCLDFLVRLP